MKLAANHEGTQQGRPSQEVSFLVDAATNAQPLESIVRSNGPQPTEEAYTDILFAFYWFNERLFERRLDVPLITLSRKPRMLGAFAPYRFERNSGERAHEIMLNPQYLRLRDDYGSLSTLVHEMAHQWREDFGPDDSKGKCQRRGYHDEVWAACMERIGLVPSDTGRPGGKRTGTRVSHFIVQGGPFDVAAQELISRGFVIRWGDRLATPLRASPGVPGESAKLPRTSRAKDRIKFSCLACGLNAWAKPSAQLKCAPCDALLAAQTPAET